MNNTFLDYRITSILETLRVARISYELFLCVRMTPAITAQAARHCRKERASPSMTQPRNTATTGMRLINEEAFAAFIWLIPQL